MQIQPLGTRVLLKPITKEKQTASGISLPDNTGKKSNLAVIERLGLDFETNSFTGEKIMVGTTVIISEIDFDTVIIDAQEYLIGQFENILAYVNENSS